MSATALVEIEDARRMVLGQAQQLGAEHVPLAEALGRVLARDVDAPAPVPGFDNSAMDGFAVRSADVAGAREERPLELRVVGESRAGAPANRALRAGEAIAISTGAQLPEGADAVVPVELTRGAGASVKLLGGAAAGEHVRRAGDDVRAGERVLAAGSALGPAELGVLASVGCAAASCSRRPRLALLVSGDELLAPSEAMRPGGVRDSNSYTVPALARRAGAQVTSAARMRDDRAQTRTALAGAVESAEVTVVCGGVSVGEHDHVRQALRELGAREIFWGLALKPGKPAWFGTVQNKLVFGLPGNPVSAMVTFTLLVRPALRALQGARDRDHAATALMAGDYEKPPGRAHALRCRLRNSDLGWVAEPTGPQGSHVLSSMLGADALAIVPSATERVRAGERVAIEPLAGPWGDAA